MASKVLMLQLLEKVQYSETFPHPVSNKARKWTGASFCVSPCIYVGISVLLLGKYRKLKLTHLEIE